MISELTVGVVLLSLINLVWCNIDQAAWIRFQFEIVETTDVIVTENVDKNVYSIRFWDLVTTIWDAHSYTIAIIILYLTLFHTMFEIVLMNFANDKKCISKIKIGRINKTCNCSCCKHVPVILMQVKRIYMILHTHIIVIISENIVLYLLQYYFCLTLQKNQKTKNKKTLVQYTMNTGL